MRKRMWTMSLLTLMMFFVITGFNKTDLNKDFAAFDKAFVPPLALTNQGKVKPSMKGMKLLMQSWKSLKAKYYDANPNDPQWKGDFDKIEAQIMSAGKIVKGGQDLMKAHEELEEIRIITMEMRKRNNIYYFIDPLTEFHILMENMFHTGKDNSPEDLSPDMIQDLSETLVEAKALWKKIGKNEFDPTIYSFNDQKTAQMKMFLKKEMKALDNLGKAIESKDNAKIIEAAKGVKPNYAKLYKMFGDFDSIKKK